VTLSLDAIGVDVILLDIEGTTTPIRFVYEVLFPYARDRMRGYLDEHASDPEIAEAIDDLLLEGGIAGSGNVCADAAADIALALMDADSKSATLKRVQGLIWRDGYASGALHGDVFDDVPLAIDAWRATGRSVAIYSSGSVLAQKLLFGSTRFGDLTRSMSAFFDTAVGPKRSADSYRAIGQSLDRPTSAILFVSDVVAELDAARDAGCHGALAVRPGNHPQPQSTYPTIRSFDDIR
jgi:enolase-phosphatase E1